MIPKPLRSRRLIAIIILILVVAGSSCSDLSLIKLLNGPDDEATPTRAVAVKELKGSPLPTESAVPSKVPETSTVETVPTFTPKPATLPATEEIPPTDTPTSVPKDLALMADGLRLYPVPSIFEGDLVTIQIDPSIPDRLAPNDVDVSILIDGEELVTGNLNWRNLNGDASGLYQWIWNTEELAGEHTVTAIVDPKNHILIGDEDAGNNQADITVLVRSAASLTEIEANASWIQVANNCCTIHVVSGTAAYRDLDFLVDQVDLAFTQAASALGEPLKEPYNVFLIDRVIGQGGYASDSMVVSYLDRDYAGSGIFEVLVHEAVHLLDKQFAPDRISFFSEGLAVWATGGHYQQENINQKMAGVVEGGLYVPIEQVANEIYSLQHELSYLEAASFLSYLIETYGWERFRAFYSDTGSDDGSTIAEAVNENLLNHFGKTFNQAEIDWRIFLSQQPRDRSAVTNLRTTIRFYEVMRQYQQDFDPSAYYLFAWLPSPTDAVEMDVTADLTRHPETSANIALEAILVSAKKALVEGNYRLSNAYLDSVERVLNNEGRFLDPLANSYLSIVRSARAGGYEVQEIDLIGNQALVLATEQGDLEVSELTLELVDSSTWVLTR